MNLYISIVIKEHKTGFPWSAVQCKELNSQFLITKDCHLPTCILYGGYVDTQQSLVALYSEHIMCLLMTYLNSFLRKAS